MFLVGQRNLVRIPLHFVILGEHFLRVGLNLSSEIYLHICIVRCLGRIADSRRRKDIVDEVIGRVIVGTAICEVSIGLEVTRFLCLSQVKVLFHNFFHRRAGRNV